MHASLQRRGYGDRERRFGSTTLDPAQQNLRREEEIRLQADLNECNRRAR